MCLSELALAHNLDGHLGHGHGTQDVEDRNVGLEFAENHVLDLYCNQRVNCKTC